jgi:hypothetical protein
MITFEFDNKKISLPRRQSLRQMLQNPTLLELSLAQWRELLLKKDGICSANTLKNILKTKIQNYDMSSDVNGFYINGEISWLDKATRVGLAHLADCTDGDISLVLGTVIIQINSALAKELLA